MMRPPGARFANSFFAESRSRARIETGRGMYASTYMFVTGIPPERGDCILHGSNASNGMAMKFWGFVTAAEYRVANPDGI